ncbi:MAG: hypothetical protein EGQ16_05515 [Clostridiales bacterium]|nr:hypothetical protein [Clostridiales bacterium]MBD9159276.1 hypothetical protein [Clostridiales bacterium]
MRKITKKEDSKNKLKNNKDNIKSLNSSGITLIALVITIIVLLILAGVSIAMLTGQNGILTQAQNAKTAAEEATEKEQRQLSQVEASTHLENYTYTDAEGKTAKIPARFAVSNVEGENLVKNGLVIIGENGNEYVWIPCTKDTYKREETAWEIEEDNETRAIKDELTLTNATPSKEESDVGVTVAVLNEIVEQVNKEIASVKANGGYYIGRYEVGKENNIAVVKQNHEPYANVKWIEAYALAKGMDVGNKATSYLCSSYAWDTAVKFIETHSTATDYGATRENSNENWTDKEVKDKNGNVIKKAGVKARLNTGLTTSWANIYDMGGNVAEFTTELNPNLLETVILRGGAYHDDSAASGGRWDIVLDGIWDNVGFRSTLFLK